MAAPACTEEQFIKLFKELKSPTAVAKTLGVTPRSVQARAERIRFLGVAPLPVENPISPNTQHGEQKYSKAISQIEISDGYILIGSDAHIWDTNWTCAQRAFIKFAKDLKPHTVILNGDIFDGASVSRHASIGWEQSPTVKQELESAVEFCDQVLKASPNSKRFWPAGNHDMRFETRLAERASEYKGINGLHLKDHVAGWQPCWRVDVNVGAPSYTIVRHREKGGIHADYRNVIESGCSLVTGHDHRLTVEPWVDYRQQIRYGVRTGYMAASPYEPQFLAYLEARHPNWISGFMVLKFANGQLMWPQAVRVMDDEHVEYLGEKIRV
jgi:hypothetical protein